MDNVMAPQAITRSADHRYSYEGVTYPGVTSILDVLDKSGPLMSWASRQTAEAAIRLHSDGSLASMLNSVGDEGTIKALTARSTWQRDEAAQLGTDVHALADKVVRGDPTPPMSEGIRTRVLAYADWWQHSGWTMRLSEAMIVNTEWSYGGTFDLLATDPDGRTVLADIKTGGKVNRKAYESEVLQLAAYGAFTGTLVQATDGKVYPMPHVDRFVLLHLTLDGLRPIEVAIGARDMSAFCSCIDLHDWLRGRKI